MKLYKLTIGALCTFSVIFAGKCNDEEEKEATTPMSNTVDPFETLHNNFLKSMSTILLQPSLEPELVKTVHTLMRTVINKEPEKDGYWTYLVTTMLRFVDQPVVQQLVSMLSIMESAAPKGSPVIPAANHLASFLLMHSRADVRIVHSDLETFVKDLLGLRTTSNPELQVQSVMHDQGGVPARVFWSEKRISRI